MCNTGSHKSNEYENVSENVDITPLSEVFVVCLENRVLYDLRMRISIDVSKSGE